MTEKKKEQTLQKMIEISDLVDEELKENGENQERKNIIYYQDFEFKRSGLGQKNVYIVEVENAVEKEKSKDQKEKEKYITYQIYDEDNELIANVDKNGKIHFTEAYIESLKEVDENYFELLKIDGIDLELPEELKENDLVMTKEELIEYREKTSQEAGKKPEGAKKEQETEEEKKEKTAQALQIEPDQIRAISTIDPKVKVTDKENLIDLMPEVAKYEEISIICTKGENNSQGRFTILGIKEDGTREELKGIEPIEGTSTNKEVISINEDGTEVKEKQVQGLFRINSRNKTNGLSVSIGDYGMMDIDYVSNVMDKEKRRSTAITTKEGQNKRIASAKVKENAGDSMDEMEKEGEKFRKNQDKGIDPQSLDGIETDEYYGKTLEEVKEEIIKQTLEKGEMSIEELRQTIKEQLEESGLELTDTEIEKNVDEIATKVVDEKRANREISFF